VSPETERAQRYRRKSPQKRPIPSRRRDLRFRRTGWWCAQSYANRSPCYLANIRVIFENNSEPAAKSVKKTCGKGISLILRQFDIREEQGAPNCRNTERAFDELGGAKRTHSDQESGPTSYGLIQAVPVANQIRTYWWCSRRELGDKECVRPVRWRAKPAHPSPRIDACVPHYNIQIRQQHMSEVPLSEQTTWSRHSRRIEPISRSAYPFCHGERGDVGRSRMPIDRSRRMKTMP